MPHRTTQLSVDFERVEVSAHGQASRERPSHIHCRIARAKSGELQGVQLNVRPDAEGVASAVETDDPTRNGFRQGRIRVTELAVEGCLEPRPIEHASRADPTDELNGGHESAHSGKTDVCVLELKPLKDEFPGDAEGYGT